MNRKVLAINSVIVIVLFLILAKTISIAITMGLSTQPPTISSPLDDFKKPKRAPSLDAHAVILTNGLMGPATKGNLTPALPASTTTAAGTTTAAQDVLLLGTVQGAWKNSFILVKKISTNEEQVFRIGERVYDLGTLTQIKKETAIIKTSASSITLYPPNQLPPQGSPPPANHSGITPASLQESGIIDKHVLTATLDNLGTVMTDARLLPSMKDGKVEGFKVTEIKPKGAFGTIGLRNNDILVRVNDFPVDAPEKAVQTLLSLRGQTRLKLDIIRNGKATTLSYDIR